MFQIPAESDEHCFTSASFITRDFRLSLVEFFVDRDEKIKSHHRSPRVIALTDWVVTSINNPILGSVIVLSINQSG